MAEMKPSAFSPQPVRSKAASFLFATRLAMVKQVPGEEFETNNRMVAATKLQEEDSVVSVTMINGETDIVLQTTGGNFCDSR